MDPKILATRSNLLPIVNEEIRPLTLGTGLVGFCIGGYKGASIAAKRIDLECLHCPPKSKSEFNSFFRHRNNKILGSLISEGAKFSAKFMIISLSFGLVSSSIRYFLPDRSAVFHDSISAGVIGSLFMSINGSVPILYYARRGLLLGSISGLSLGLIRMSC